MGRRKNRSNTRWSWWRQVSVIVIAFMTATYWTLRAVQAAIDLHNTVVPW
ncbi:hypothetical protein ACWCRD_43645 [Streptomyces sp. NPDC002092]